jgi:NTE family protein
MRIGVALSGGGFRATVFHLGVLARLAKTDHMERVAFLSTVSGGSLCIGLVYALSDWVWPSSRDYMERVLPRAREVLTTTNLQVDFVRRVLASPLSVFRSRAGMLAKLLEERWGVTARLSQVPESPRWMINATCYETGKNWRFERFRMGDYRHGYSYDTDIPLGQALAASAGFPGLIGALPLDTRPFRWFQYRERGAEAHEMLDSREEGETQTQALDPEWSTVHLWDGGVYDNLGLEGLHDFQGGWQAGIDFLVVSDASGRSKPETYRSGARALLRIISGIMMDQIRSLRSRAILERLVNHDDRGAFLQIGNTCRAILLAAGRDDEISELCPGSLPEQECTHAANMETVIRRLSEEEFERLYRHGFEVADLTLYAYNDDKFSYLGFST